MPRKSQSAGGTPRNAKAPARQRESEVYAVAARLFNERGYAATSVENVAEALGMLKGSLYYYIDSKEDLLFNIVSEVHAESLKIIEHALSRTDLDARQRLALYVRDQVRFNASNVARVSAYYRDLDQLAPERVQEIRARQRVHFRGLVALVDEAQKSGLFAKGVNPALAAHALLSTVIWPYTWFRAGGKVTADELAAFCVGYVFGGLENFNSRADYGALIEAGPARTTGRTGGSEAPTPPRLKHAKGRSSARGSNGRP